MLDLFILVVLAAALVRGFATGVIRQVASIAGIVLAFILGVQLMRPAGGLVAGSLGVSDAVAPLAGFLLVFLAVQVAMFALVRTVETVVGALKLTVVNRAAGGLFGAFKGALALGVLFLVLGYVGIPGPNARAGSALYEPVASVLPEAWDYFSERMPQVEALSHKFGEHVRERLPDE